MIALEARQRAKQLERYQVNISDKTLVITGAGSGLGFAVAQAAVTAGANVALLDVNETALQEANQILGSKVLALKTDVTQEDSVGAAIAATVKEFGTVDVAVNCAGVAPSKRIVGRKGPHELDAFARVMSINVLGTFNVMRLAAEQMSKQERSDAGEGGVIINTASIAAYDGQIGQAAYAASKGAVASMTLPAARELAQSGIRVVTIAPGIFGTPMMTAMPQEVQDALGASVPFPPRLGDPAEFASLALHIIDNPMLNGEVIRLDGALRMAAK